jgi:lipid-binding SYLF domain-containing protein
MGESHAFAFAGSETLSPRERIVHIEQANPDFGPQTWRIIVKMKLVTAAGLVGLGLFIAAPALADTKAELNASASKALTHFYDLGAKNKELAGKAKGILIFPSVTKAGAGVAGEYGEGVLRVKGKTVDYYSVTSGSVGATLGVASHTEMIMFMTQEALDKFTQSNGWSVGADAAVAVMSEGAGGEYGSEALGKPVIGFVYSEKGLIGDVSLEGAKITKTNPKD